MVAIQAGTQGDMLRCMLAVFDLQRFLTAQNAVLPAALRELAGGRKQTHWMWFVFPQIAGLGHSAMSRRYALASRDEAAAFADHPVLGPRLRECTQLVLDAGRSVDDIFGYPDHLKFHSCMTLFFRCAKDPSIFKTALERCFDGRTDARTDAMLGFTAP